MSRAILSLVEKLNAAVLLGSKGTNWGCVVCFWGDGAVCGFVVVSGTACGKQHWGREEAKGTGVAD